MAKTERRGFFRLTGLAILFTLGAIIVACVIISAIGVLPAVLSYLWLDRWLELLARAARWPVMAGFGGGWDNAALSLWALPGGRSIALAFVGRALHQHRLLLASLAFSYYLDNFAKLQCDLWRARCSDRLHGLDLDVGHHSHHSAQRSMPSSSVKRQWTRPPECTQPMGKRGAFAADTLGETGAERAGAGSLQ